MRIPEVRARLEALALQKDMPELLELAKELRRRIRAPRGPAIHQSMTPELADKIYNYVKANPSLSYAQVARNHNVASGRISEIMHGKRE